MKKKWLFYIGFFVLLITVFLVVVSRFMDFSKAPLLELSAVNEFSFVNQDGKMISDRDVEGKVYVAEYFFTTCPSICPRMNANMRKVYDVYKSEPGFLILSHTCMPETDSVSRLKAYERKMLDGKLIQNLDGSFRIFYDSSKLPVPGWGMDTTKRHTNWQFLTGPKADLYKMARQSYIIDKNKTDSTEASKNQFLHTQFFALVDKQRKVRGIYDGLNTAEVDKLLEDIRDLLKETLHRENFNSSTFSNNPN